MEKPRTDSILDRIGSETGDAFERAEARAAARRAAALEATARTARWAGFARDPGLSDTLLWRSTALARATGAAELVSEAPKAALATVKRLAPGEDGDEARIFGHVQSPTGGGEADLIDAEGCPIASSPIDALGHYAITVKATGEPARIEIRDAHGQVAVVDGRPIALTPGLMVRRDFTTGRCGTVEPGEEPPEERLQMPDLIGKPVRAARAALKNLGEFKLSVKETHSDDAPKGIVIDQAPEPGLRIVPGDAVELIVSLGPRAQQKMPDLRGLTEKEARRALSDLAFRSVNFARVLDPENAGRVVSHDPEPGALLAEDDDITLCLGVAAHLMPDLIGRTRKEALEILVPDYIKAPKIEEVPDDGPEGIVLQHNPAAGEAVGDTVFLVISVARKDDDGRNKDKGERDDTREEPSDDIAVAYPEMPDVTGKTRARALKMLKEAGIEKVEFDETAARRRGARVLAQHPDAGEPVQDGTARLEFGKPR